jgi:arylsulfatase A-like enzyme
VTMKLFILILWISCNLFALAKRQPGDTRPNIVFYFPDTIRADALGTYGHPLSKTPNFDRLASQGVLFEDHHVQHTQCSPSRCATFTGRYMHVLGHRTQTHLIREYEDNMFKYLKQSNYTTILLGKNDVLSSQSFNDSLTFWDGIIGTSGGGNAFNQGEAGYYSFFGKASTTCKGAQWTCNGDLKAVVETIEWLKTDPPEPFFIFLPGIGAHPPYDAPLDYYAKYTSEEVRQSAPLRQLVPGNNKPPHLQVNGITGYRNLTSFHSSDDLFYNISAVYLGRIAYVDYILGVLLDGIDASPLVDNTILIASSDHGDYNGDFQAVEKWPGGLEDMLTRVPLLFRTTRRSIRAESNKPCHGHRPFTDDFGFCPDQSRSIREREFWYFTASLADQWDVPNKPHTRLYSLKRVTAIFKSMSQTILHRKVFMKIQPIYISPEAAKKFYLPSILIALL